MLKDSLVQVSSSVSHFDNVFSIYTHNIYYYYSFIDFYTILLHTVLKNYTKTRISVENVNRSLYITNLKNFYTIFNDLWSKLLYQKLLDRFVKLIQDRKLFFIVDDCIQMIKRLKRLWSSFYWIFLNDFDFSLLKDYFFLPLHITNPFLITWVEKTWLR